MEIVDAIREWLRLAGLAPSSHNTQPWRFRVDRAGVEVWTDPARSLPVNDPTGRERIISCGCAVLNLRAAAAADGHGLTVRPVTDAESRAEVADLIRAATTAQWKNPAWRRELAHWMRPPSRGDGLPVGRMTGGLTRWSVRHLVSAQAMARAEAHVARAAPLLLTLGTGIEGPMQWLTAGQALQRVLLEESYDARPLASGIRAWWSLGFACDNGQRTASTDAFASREKGAE
ncbi:hypothetical protein [Thioalkalivibrio sp. ALR17-21]|uniref:hypothetical protein n=1 Tax=Thioalkalivibrio sp. ALR17-21 TaxID=1269813 RepID=UPI0004273D28